MPAAEESDREGADGFVTYMMLQVGKDDAYQMIMGATFTFKNFIDKSMDGIRGSHSRSRRRPHTGRPAAAHIHEIAVDRFVTTPTRATHAMKKRRSGRPTGVFMSSSRNRSSK
jgi:hypothetical protein